MSTTRGRPPGAGASQRLPYKQPLNANGLISAYHVEEDDEQPTIDEAVSGFAGRASFGAALINLEDKQAPAAPKKRATNAKPRKSSAGGGRRKSRVDVAELEAAPATEEEVVDAAVTVAERFKRISQ
ncbi:unnamed protein product, partial [Amoebophrya sp. A120]|eukprot:GSA120T00005422001.1